METKVEVVTNGTLKAVEIRAQVNLIHEVMDSVMKKDVHYGIIPGCKKPSLYKPGAEKILMTFRLVADNPIIEDLSTADSIRYRVTQRILTASGNLVGAASGECSSDEDKYKWRRPVCNEEFDETPVDRRGEKWVKDHLGKASKIKRIRTNPADVGNTILKMAVKRAVIGATLITTAASDVFDQDIEDIPAEMLDTVTNGDPKPPIKQPEKKTADKPAAPAEEKKEAPKKKANNPISEPQSKRLFAIAMGNGYTGEDINVYLQENYGIESSRDIERESYEAIVEHFQVKKDVE
jgi:hypothetical protein